PDQYRIRRKRSTMIITSRGCPHGCAYCSSHLVMGSSFRKRSPEAVLEEMFDCYKRHGITAFDVEDDNFTFDQARTKRLMELIIDTFGEGFLKLYAMNGISFASLNSEILKLMKRAGFHSIGLSYVSTDISFKERMGRPSSTVDFDLLSREAEEIGFQVTAYAIFGIPGQTINEMVDTLVYLTGKRVLIGPSIYYPVPGTPLFEMCKTDNILPLHPSQWRSSALPIETAEFKRLDLVTLLRLARLINFIKGKMDRREVEEGISWKELRQIMQEKKDSSAWMDLVLHVLEEKSFFSVRENFDGELSPVKEASSQAVMDKFFEKACGIPILKSRGELPTRPYRLHS
ncbi:MAG: radical SAM protein, partial [Proteobacteria bacterium]|nr:radical SAM protein [Pseudomonadota bacterium]